MTRRIIEASFEYKCHIPMYVEYKNALMVYRGHHGQYYRVRIDTSEPATLFDHSCNSRHAGLKGYHHSPDNEAVRAIEAIAAACRTGEVITTSWDFLPAKADVGHIRMSLCSVEMRQMVYDRADSRVLRYTAKRYLCLRAICGTTIR